MTCRRTSRSIRNSLKRKTCPRAISLNLECQAQQIRYVAGPATKLLLCKELRRTRQASEFDISSHEPRNHDRLPGEQALCLTHWLKLLGPLPSKAFLMLVSAAWRLETDLPTATFRTIDPLGPVKSRLF
jgi:hypothetical protein